MLELVTVFTNLAANVAVIWVCIILLAILFYGG